MKKLCCFSIVWGVSLGLVANVSAQQPPADAGSELAKKLNNPVADLISVPIKLNWDTGIGTADADRTTLFLQPVIPFELNKQWNLISRTIAPVIHAQSPVAGGDTESGLGAIANYTTNTLTTFGINSESTYDWEAKRWTVPINLSVGQLTKDG